MRCRFTSRHGLNSHWISGIASSRAVRLLALPGVLVTVLATVFEAADQRPVFPDATQSRFIDCSLIVAPDYPATWPSAPFPQFNLIHQKTIGPDSPVHVDSLLIDGNTGTQLDVPPHSVARPDLNLPTSGPLGLAYTDRIPAWQFGGEACVVDVRKLLDQAPNGTSPLVTPEHVVAFEKQHRELRFGDVVLFRSDYSDLYYKPLPQGRRYIADVLDRKAPGYPDPNPDCMEFLATRGVMTLGTDSASMGPLPNLAEPTHYAGLKHGMIWTEGTTNLNALPPTGAFYIMLGPKHANGPYGEGRALAITGGELPARLIASCKEKRVIDLSPTLTPGMPLTFPGHGTGNHRQVYLKIDFLYAPTLDLFHHTHLMDSMAGTHLVPPAYALPAPGTNVEYSPEVRIWLDEYERDFGPRGFSSRTTEKVPLDWMAGRARVIDVRSLQGSTRKVDWPVSPAITPKQVHAYERQHGDLQPGDVVIFRTDHVANYYQPAPDDQDLFIKPLAGDAEGWPAPSADTIHYLHSRGIRCVATDAPDLGGTSPGPAIKTYWSLGSRDMVGVEFLTSVADIPDNAWFLFAPVKIRDCHGGPGRAVVFY